MKLTEAVDLFFRVHTPIRSEQTMITYDQALRLNFLPYILERHGDPDLEDLTRDQMRAYRTFLLNREREAGGRKHGSMLRSEEAKRREKNNLLSKWTVNRYFRGVKRLFNWLVQEGILDARQSPVLGVENVNPGTTAAGSIPREAIVKMLAVASGPPLLSLYQARDTAIVSLMNTPGPTEGLYCGSGELSRLRLDDVDIERGRLRLRARSRSHPPEETEFDIYLNPLQEQLLKRWLRLRPPHDCEYVFITLDNRAGAGGGEALGQKAVYSAYWKEANLTAEQIRVRKEEIKRKGAWAARRLALLLFFLDTGARLGGVMSLTRDRLDLAGRRAVVLEKGRGGPKPRTVFFSDVTADALEKWLAADNRENKATIFGMKGNESRAGAMLAALAEQAGVEGVPTNPHAFRHSFARFVIEGGADLSQASRLLGHSSIKVTADFYIHWDVEKLAEVHEKASPVANLSQLRPSMSEGQNVPGS